MSMQKPFSRVLCCPSLRLDLQQSSLLFTKQQPNNNCSSLLIVCKVQALRLCTCRAARRGVEVQFYSFLTTALEGGEGSASRSGRSLPPGKTRYPLYRRLGGPQGRSGQMRKISSQPGFDPRTFQPVASRYTDYATRSTYSMYLNPNYGPEIQVIWKKMFGWNLNVI